jgi:hypothetical protein
MAALCGMTYLPPFTLFSARTAVQENRLQPHVSAWVRLIQALQEDNLDISKARSLPILNINLDVLIRGNQS